MQSWKLAINIGPHLMDELNSTAVHGAMA